MTGRVFAASRHLIVHAVLILWICTCAAAQQDGPEGTAPPGPTTPAAAPAPAAPADGPDAASISATGSAAAKPTASAQPAASSAPRKEELAVHRSGIVQVLGAIVLLVVAAALVALVIGAWVLLKRFNTALDQRLPFGTRGHWGGFGGGETGWEMSPGLTLLAALTVVAAAITVLGSALVNAAAEAIKPQVAAAEPAPTAVPPKGSPAKKPQ